MISNTPPRGENGEWSIYWCNTTYLDNADEMRKTKGTEEEGTTMRAKSMGMKKNDIVA